jgi:hypothetical protein
MGARKIMFSEVPDTKIHCHDTIIKPSRICLLEPGNL